MKHKAIFFDADGVLIKSKRRFTDKLQEDFGLDPEKAQPFFREMFKECVAGRADLKIELAKVMRDWDWQGSVEELMDYWFTKGSEIDEAVAGFIRGLRREGLRTYLTTDQERYRGEHLRRTLEGMLFSKVFFSAELGCTKNTPEYWEQVYAAVQNMTMPVSIRKDEIFYIDDGPENVAAAKAFGIDVYLYEGDLGALGRMLTG